MSWWQNWGNLTLSFVGYLLLWRFFPLRPFFNQTPPHDIFSFANTSLLGFAYALLLLFLVWFHLRQARQSPLPLYIILLGTLLLALPLLDSYPYNATDVYRYLIRGRVNSLYGGNSFADPPTAFPEDPFLPLAGEWAGETTPYGPLWELVAWGITAVSGNNLLLGLYLFKLVGLGGHLLITLLLWRLLVGRQSQAMLTLLWAWHPALLLTFVVNAHNDAWLLVWLLLGWLVGQKKPLLGFWLMALGALTKPIGLLALPVAWLIWLRTIGDWNGRFRFGLLSSLGAALLALLLFLPFGSPVDLFVRLVSEASAGAGFSPAALLMLLVREYSIPLRLATLAQWLQIFFILSAAFICWQVWWQRRGVRKIADLFALYLLTALNFRLWYTSWLFPWLLIEEEAPTWRLGAGYAFLVTTQLSVLIYAHLRIFGLDNEMFHAHLIGIPFVFGLPLLLGRLFLNRR